MEKVHSRINWENYPSIATPLNEANLNKMDKALDEVDNRVLGLDTAKLDKSTANTMVKDVTFDESTGIFTVTLLNGTAKTIDTKLEKVVTNFRYDNQSQKLVLTLADGSEQQVDLSSLISNYEFADGNIITFIIGSDGKVTANVKDGSITETKLQPNFLANVKTEVAKAKSYADSSYENATTSRNAVTEAKQYRDEALQFRNEAESFTPEGYADLVEQVNENTVKVDTIIDKADLGIKETATGEEIHLIDSAEGKAVEFALYGKAKQNTTSGNQLFDYENNLISADGLNVVVNADKSLSVIGTTTKNYVKVCLDNNVTLEAGKYYVSGGKNEEGYVYVQVQKIKANGGTSNSVNGSFTVDGTEQKIYFIIQTGGYQGNINCTIYPMINKGETALPFEPFTNGATPRPDYPQPIEVSGASGSVAVKSCGKNKFNGVQRNGQYADGVWYNNVARLTTDFIKIKSRTIAFSLNSSALNMSFINFNYFDKDKKWLGNRITLGMDAIGLTQRSVVATFPNNAKYVSVTTRSYNDGQSAIDSLTLTDEMLMIEESPIVTPYEPYKETLATIPTENGLAGIKVSSNGNYTDQNGQQWICDEIVKYADGSGEKIQRVGKVVFDGSEDEKWSTGGTSQDGKRRMSTEFLKNLVETAPKTPNASSVVINALCNISVVTRADTQGTYGANNGCSVVQSGTLYVYSDMYNTNDVSLWTSYLAENPMEFYYELETPITTPLTAEEIAEIEKLHTFYPVTNISNDFDCGMSVTYYADSKNYIDKKISELATAMVNNI